MNDQDFLNTAILVLAILFLLLGFGVLLVRGLMGRTNVDTTYGVGRQQSRQVKFQESLTGLLLALFGVVLLGLWYVLGQNPLPARSAEPASFASPTFEPLNTPVPATDELLPTEVVETAVPTDTPEPTVEPTEVLPTETPVLLVEASPTPIPEPTRVPVGATINTEYLNLRIDPGNDGAVLVLLREKDDPVLAVLNGYEKQDGYFWREVELENGTQGWVAEAYLTYLYGEE